MKLEKRLFAGVVSIFVLSACGPIPFKSDLEKSDSAIVGGEDILLSDKAASSVVGVYNDVTGELCTGVLLPVNIVLTAAHCIGDNIKNMFIYFGSSLNDQSAHRTVDKMESHPSWKARQFSEFNRFDLALIHYSGTTPEGYTAAKLTEKIEPKAGLELTLVGYGVNNGADLSGAGVLRKTKLKIASASTGSSEIIVDQRKGSGVCHGDSGGPAFVEKDKKLYVIAVTSRGVEDKKNDCSQFAALTLLAFHRAWIERIALRLSTPINSLIPR